MNEPMIYLAATGDSRQRRFAVAETPPRVGTREAAAGGDQPLQPPLRAPAAAAG